MNITTMKIENLIQLIIKNLPIDQNITLTKNIDLISLRLSK